MTPQPSPLSENDHTRADPDLTKGHPLLQERWAGLVLVLEKKYGWRMRVVEVYRPELRQQWLFGSGRTVAQLADRGIVPQFARPNLPRVTNAWSAQVSAHGATVRIGGSQAIPAAAALDVSPVGEDGKAFTRDDPWDAFVAAMAAEGPMVGLVHFHSAGKAVHDKPHLQLWPEWSDSHHRLLNV